MIHGDAPLLMSFTFRDRVDITESSNGGPAFARAAALAWLSAQGRLRCLPYFLNGRHQQADQDRDDGDDHESRRAVLHESAGAVYDRSVTEVDGIAPGEVDLAVAHAVLVGVRAPVDHS